MPVISVSSAADPGMGLVNVNLFDGARRAFGQRARVLVTIHDGAQNQLYRDEVSGPNITFQLPVHHNFSDKYSIVVWAEGFEQAGFQPVTVGSNTPQALDLMLLAKTAEFRFAQARWADVIVKKPLLSKIFAASVNGGDAGAAYGQLLEAHPDRLACLLNITTAMQQIFLAQGTPLDYFKKFDLLALAPDRIFGYADAELVKQVRLAAQHGHFATEPGIDLALHGDATSSFKQIQFGEANVQLTFREKNRKTIDGVDCVYVEPDIDYYKDLGAHLLLEVIGNALTGKVSNPRVVYVLRWIAGRYAGVPEFDPLYTIE